MLNTTIQREIQADEYNASFRGYVARALLGAAYYIAPLAGLAALVTGAGCDDNGGGTDILPTVPPTASLVVTPPDGAKPLDVLLDASGSYRGTGTIDKVAFDFDGDGTDDYVETPGSAPDGNWDKKTTATYPDAGDFTPKVTVRGSTGSDSAKGDLDVGFGVDEPGLIAYVDTLLTGAGYTCTLDQDFQLFNPSTGLMTAYTGLKAELSDEIIYVPNNWASLTAEQLATLAARAAEGMDDPEVVVPSPDDSPETIDALFGL